MTFSVKACVDLDLNKHTVVCTGVCPQTLDERQCVCTLARSPATVFLLGAVYCVYSWQTGPKVLHGHVYNSCFPCVIKQFSGAAWRLYEETNSIMRLNMLLLKSIMPISPSGYSREKMPCLSQLAPVPSGGIPLPLPGQLGDMIPPANPGSAPGHPCSCPYLADI